MTTLLAIAIDVVVIAVVALLVVATMRRPSAALRHAVLAVAFIAAACMPLFELALPTMPLVEWPLAERTVSSSLAMSSDVVATDAGLVPAPVSEATAFSWTAMLMTVWVVGLVSVLGRLLGGFVHLARLESRSRVMDTGRWRQLADELSASLSLRQRVTILQSPDPALLVTYGFWRPKLVVPVDADTWSDERIQMALTHELAHVRRRDATMTLFATVVCALHWFNPLVWLCARGLRRESECACDDAVLRQGMEPTRYAALLLSVARGDAACRRAWITAPAIAHPSTLERRVAAMLQRPRNRAPVTRLAKTLVAIATGAVVMPLAAAGIAPATENEPAVTIGSDLSLVPVQHVGRDAIGVAAPAAVAARPPATVSQPQTGATLSSREDVLRQSRERSRSLFRRMGALENTHDARDPSSLAAATARAAAAAQESGSMTGTAVDASGAVVPGVTVRLFDPSRGFEVRTTMTDANGQFLFRDVLVGQYELTLALPGFATVHATLPITRDATVTRRLLMPLGTVEETISVGCSPRAAVDAGPGFVARFGQMWARGLDAFMPALAAQEPPRPLPVRVGGNIQMPRKVKDVRPVCPQGLVPATGATVSLAGRIGRDGFMYDVMPVGPSDSQPSVELIDAARSAVGQWVFSPTLLNGQPVEANINIRVSYRP